MKQCLDEGLLQSYLDVELPRETAESVASHLAWCGTCAQAARELENASLLFSQAIEPEFAVKVPTELLRHRIDAAIAELQVANPARSSNPPPARSWPRSLADLFALSPQRAIGYASLAVAIAFAILFSAVYLKRGHSISPAETAKQSSPAPNTTPKSSQEVAVAVNPVAPADKKLVIKLVGYTPKNPLLRHPARVTEDTERLLPGEQNYIKTIATLDATIKSDSRQMQPGLQVEYEHNLAMIDHAIAATRDAAQKSPNDPAAAQFMFAAYQSKVDLLSQVAGAQLFNKQR